MGSVNCYLITGEPLTLIDSGPGLTASSTALCRALEAIGHAPSEIALLVATHHHFDHIGAMSALADRSGAGVAALDVAAPLLAAYDRFRREDDDWLAGQMMRHGVAPASVASVRMFAELESHLAGPVRVSVPLQDGAWLRAGERELRVHHRPGHSVSDIILHDEQNGVIFSGDHLLASVSSNALMSLPLTGGGIHTARAPALRDYRASLRLTARLGDAFVLPGHGAAFHGHRQVVSRRLAQQDRRAARFLKRLAEGPRTAFSLGQDVWGPAADSQVLLVLSEVLGHLDLLEAPGVVERRDEGVSRWELAS
jgi:glyoxylase-like metal-dependent hydrolase (beta-lactamase superfamily II)